METSAEELIPASCDYCGRKNTDRLANCAGCGTPLVNQPPKKSMAVAICLALVFGPFGLLYLRAWITVIVMVFFMGSFVFVFGESLWFTLSIQIITALWAYSLLKEKKSNPTDEAARLLDEAAHLENIDRSQAITAYEKIIRSYPNTSAGKEAEQTLQALKRQR